MLSLRSFLLLVGAGLALAAPKAPGAQTHGDTNPKNTNPKDTGKACFLVGSTPIPVETQHFVQAIQSKITCDKSKKTIDGVPDVTSGKTSFSSINFKDDKQLSALAFALKEFATTSPLDKNDLATFEDKLNVYQATEAGIRSQGGNLKIKIPKFFLAFQVARIKAAKKIVEKNPGQTVEHLLGKVLKNSAQEDQALKDKVTALSKTLS